MIYLALLLLLLLCGCTTSPRIVNKEVRAFSTSGTLKHEVKQSVVIAPAKSDEGSSVETETVKAKLGKGTTTTESDLRWVIIIGAAMIVFAVVLAWKGWWTTAIYPAGGGVGLIVLAVTLQKFPLVYLILGILAVLAVVGHLVYAYYKGVKDSGVQNIQR